MVSVSVRTRSGRTSVTWPSAPVRRHVPSASRVTGEPSLAVAVSARLVASTVMVTTVASGSYELHVAVRLHLAHPRRPWGAVVVEGSTAGVPQSHGYPVTLMSPLSACFFFPGQVPGCFRMAGWHPCGALTKLALVPGSGPAVMV